MRMRIRAMRDKLNHAQEWLEIETHLTADIRRSRPRGASCLVRSSLNFHFPPDREQSTPVVAAQRLLSKASQELNDHDATHETSFQLPLLSTGKASGLDHERHKTFARTGALLPLAFATKPLSFGFHQGLRIFFQTA